jgi:hypothetical protein
VIRKRRTYRCTGCGKTARGIEFEAGHYAYYTLPHGWLMQSYEGAVACSASCAETIEAALTEILGHDGRFEPELPAPEPVPIPEQQLVKYPGDEDLFESVRPERLQMARPLQTKRGGDEPPRS